MNKKKAYTQPDSNAADKFFSTLKQEEAEGFTNNIDDNSVSKHTNVSNVTKHTNVSNVSKHTNVSNVTNVTKHTNVSNVSKHTNVSNKSKHYDERGKRSERCGLLMDINLKEDLRLLSNALGNKSVNDFIVTILLEYIDDPINQHKLNQYKKLMEK